MPAKWLGLRCRLIFTLCALLLIVSAVAEAQTGRVVLNATVSETVTLSVAPTFSHSNVSVVTSGGNTVRITFSGDDPVIRIPLLVRSNTSFKISAESTAEVSQLLVTDVHATGRQVSPQAVNRLKPPPKFDLNAGPLLLVSGPRVSLGGTLDSPNNALEITVLIRFRAPGSLTFVATAGSPIQ